MWLKGCLHTHTNRSDGDSDPLSVCDQYAEAGYDFIAITDHNVFTDPSALESGRLLLIPGIELSTASKSEPHVPLHVNGLGVRTQISVEPAETKSQTLQGCVDAITAAGGIAQINHPNFHFALTQEDIYQVRGARLLEIYNGHPLVNNAGDELHISVEELWDQLLSSGVLIYGTAVDDSHHFAGHFQPGRANPFRGWVWVRVTRPTVRDVLRGLATGDFYSSTGVRLEDVFVDGSVYHVIVNARSAATPDTETYLTQFIGSGGRVLFGTTSLHSTFDLRGVTGSNYVRARVIGPDGTKAWCQPRLVPSYWRV
ncbi:MAG: PHP domain-containing protein [Armatimonadota bacterium]